MFAIHRPPAVFLCVIPFLPFKGEGRQPILTNPSAGWEIQQLYIPTSFSDLSLFAPFTPKSHPKLSPSQTCSIRKVVYVKSWLMLHCKKAFLFSFLVLGNSKTIFKVTQFYVPSWTKFFLTSFSLQSNGYLSPTSPLPFLTPEPIHFIAVTSSWVQKWMWYLFLFL